MKRTLSFVLCFCLIFSMFGTALVGTAGAAVTQYNDLPTTHWGFDEIMYMSSKSILQGNLGNFRADDTMTKAEFIKVINYTFGLNQTSYKSFADVSTSKWYYNDIMKAASHGYLTTNGNYVYPDSQLTREEACALVARYLGLSATYNYNRFTDSAQISYAYQAYVNACAENGIVNGYPNGEFRPKNVLTRAEASTIIYRLAGTIYTASAYGTDAAANPTNAVINTNGVTVSNANLSGTVYVSEGTEYGTITLQNCTVNGTLKVTGAATINLINTTVAKLVVDTTSGNAPTINVSGTSVVNAAEVNSSAKIVNGSTYTGNAVRAITMAADPYATLTLDGEFQAVTVNNPYNYIALNDADTVIKKLTVAQGATNNKVTGNGKIEDTVIAAAGANYSVVPVKYAISNGITAIFAGNQYTGTGAASTYPKYYFVDGALEIRELRNTSGTMYYVIVPNNAAAPTAQQVINGVNYSNVTLVDAGSINLSAGYENVDTSINLASSTNYDLYTYFKANNASVTGAPEKIDLYTATTPSFVANYPTYGTLTYVSANNYTMPIKVKATASCTAYAIAVAKGSTAPSASQIYETAKGSTSYNANVAIASRAVVSVSANTETTISLTGLANSSYDYYVVLANASAAPVAIRSTNTVVTSVDTGFAAGYPVVTNVANNYVTVALKTSTAGTAYVLPYNSAAYVPTASQIMSSGTAVAMSTLSGDGYYYNSATVYMYGSDKVAVVFVPSYSAAKVPVYGTIYTGTVLYPAASQATSTGFRAGYPQITWLNVANNQLTLTARTNEAGRVYLKGYSNVVPTAAEIYTYNVSFPVSYDASLGCYVGSKTVGYANPNIAALFVPANGTYATYLPVYGAIGAVQGTILYPQNAPSTNVPVVTITSAVDAANKPIYVSYSEKMYLNNTALSAQTAPETLKALFPITAADGSAVPAYTVSVGDNPNSPYNTVVTITPATGWTEGVTYTVTPNSSIKNAAGNAPVVKSGSFKVNVTRPSAVLAPATGVQTKGAVLTLTFTQAMALKTVDGAIADLTNANIGSYVTVYKNGDSSNPVNATATISEDKKVVTITVADTLAANTKYDVKLSASVVNAAGTAPAATTYNFTTVAQGAVATPVIVVKSGDELVNADTLKAGTYTVAITYDNTTSKVYYTLDGKTPADGSNEYTGEIEITIAPKQEIKIKAIAKANTGTDLASSVEATRTLVGEEVTISANPASGSAVTAGTDVELTTSYGAYTIKFIKSAEKVTKDLEATVVAGTTYTTPVEDIAGKYLYAVAVDASGNAIGPVAEFYYPAFVAGNLISIKTDLTDGYAETADVISIGYAADADIDYNYELIATILINGEPLIYNGEDVVGYNFGKKMVQFSVKDTVNAKIEVEAEIVAAGYAEGAAAPTVTDSDLFFANPMPVINVTTGTGADAKTTSVTGDVGVYYNTYTTVAMVQPENLPDGFAWTWGTREINDVPFNTTGTLSTEINKDIKVEASATAGGKEFSNTANILVQPVAPKLVDADGNEMASTIDYAAGTAIAVEYIDGSNHKNTVEVGSADAVALTENIVPVADWGSDKSVKVTLTATYTDEDAKITRTAKTEYTLNNAKNSSAIPSVTVKVNGEAVTGALIEVQAGDTIEATSSIVGGTVALTWKDAADKTVGGNLDNPYTFVAADAGWKLEMIAQIVDNESLKVSQYVVVVPEEPVINVVTEAKAGRVDLIYLDKNGKFDGIDYTINGVDGNVTVDKAQTGTFGTANDKCKYFIVDADLADGYTITAKAYVVVDNTKFYGDEETLFKPATPSIDGYETSTDAVYYNVPAGTVVKISPVDGATTQFKAAATKAKLESTSTTYADGTSITIGEGYNLIQVRAYETADETKAKTSNESGIYRFYGVSGDIAFAPADKTEIAETGGEKVTVTFPATSDKKFVGDVTYTYTIDGKEVTATDNTVVLPAAVEGAKSTVVTATMKIAEGETTYYEKKASAEYTYADAPEFAAYDASEYVEGSDENVNLVKSDATGTYVEVAEDTLVYVVITNDTKEVKFAIGNASLNTVYTEADLDDGYVSNIAETGKKGIVVDGEKYVSAKFADSPVAKLTLKIKAEAPKAPAAPVLKLNGKVLDASKEVLVTGDVTVALDVVTAGSKTLAMVNDETEQRDWTGKTSINVKGFDEDNLITIKIWNEKDDLSSASATYTFKKVTDNSLLNVPTIVNKNETVAAGDVLSATTAQQNVTVETKTNYVGTTVNDFAAGSYTVNTADQGNALKFDAKAVLGTFESAVVTATYYVNPTVITEAEATRVGTTITINAPAASKGTATGVKYQIGTADPVEKAFEDGKVVITGVDEDTKVKVWYYSVANGEKLEGAPYTIGGAPEITAVSTYKQTDILTPAKGVYVIGENVVINATGAQNISYQVGKSATKNATPENGTASISLDGFFKDGDTKSLKVTAIAEDGTKGDLVEITLTAAAKPAINVIEDREANKYLAPSEDGKYSAVYTDNTEFRVYANYAGVDVNIDDVKVATTEGDLKAAVLPTFDGEKTLVPTRKIGDVVIDGTPVVLTLTKLATPVITSVTVLDDAVENGATVNYFGSEITVIATEGAKLYYKASNNSYEEPSIAFDGVIKMDQLPPLTGKSYVSIYAVSEEGDKTAISEEFRFVLNPITVPELKLDVDSKDNLTRANTIAVVNAPNAEGVEVKVSYTVSGDVTSLNKAIPTDGTSIEFGELIRAYENPIGVAVVSVQIELVGKNVNTVVDNETYNIILSGVEVNGVTYASFQAALDDYSNNNDGQTNMLKLNHDVVINENAVISRRLSSGGKTITIADGASLTVEDGAILDLTAAGNIVTQGSGKIVVKPGATVKYWTGNVQKVVYGEGGMFELANGTLEITSNGTGFNAVLDGECVIAADFEMVAPDTLTINSGSSLLVNAEFTVYADAVINNGSIRVDNANNGKLVGTIAGDVVYTSAS